jgi:hypothetical protein
MIFYTCLHDEVSRAGFFGRKIVFLVCYVIAQNALLHFYRIYINSIIGISWKITPSSVKLLIEEATNRPVLGAKSSC